MKNSELLKDERHQLESSERHQKESSTELQEPTGRTKNCTGGLESPSSSPNAVFMSTAPPCEYTPSGSGEEKNERKSFGRREELKRREYAEQVCATSGDGEAIAGSVKLA